METIKLLNLAPEIRGSKNVKTKNIRRVINALPKVIMGILMTHKDVRFTPFLKLSFRTAKDRMARSNITNEMVHIPQHLRFKGSFYNEFKKYINGERNEKN